MADLNTLPETLKLHITASAMQQASESLAIFAETLAGEIEAGDVSDEGGSEMLLLFAEMIRTVRSQGVNPPAATASARPKNASVH